MSSKEDADKLLEQQVENTLGGVGNIQGKEKVQEEMSAEIEFDEYDLLDAKIDPMDSESIQNR